MKTEVLLLTGLLVALGPFLLWSAYQIQFNKRVDLVRFGSGPLPGAAFLRRQFAAVHFFHGATCLLAGTFMFVTDSAAPGIWVFAGVSCALAVKRQLLIRAIEIKATKAAAE
ncbi:hypothetical protein DBR47_09640 [Paucibacter sp. KBW04]|uniref:hypothetical protein n=1 Tax=Paucibacter sp. KBW04 TaxID=2153361 RepID=UPI000F567030|nr:hypothetical protein [Paucibacter sp. KBW04]RQO60593.1 hypothetical protein DBR47_09640 [Paucibacter sp. KBW04]